MMVGIFSNPFYTGYRKKTYSHLLWVFLNKTFSCLALKHIRRHHQSIGFYSLLPIFKQGYKNVPLRKGASRHKKKQK